MLEATHQLETEGVWKVRCIVIMPDHLHLVVALGENRSLSAGVRLFKGRLTPALRNTGAQWQAGFYDHRVRTADDLLPIFLYIFLNPYRANLCPLDRLWNGYFCCPEDWAWFRD
ncbi:MAG: Transposase like protein, partial [Lacunisphaera sp.]|nr:Transposase like protein [Lacunisphaera sp.]